MSEKKTITFCSFDITTVSVVTSSLIAAAGFIKLILYSGYFLPPIGAFCSYGGCTFDEGNLENIFLVYDVVQSTAYFLFGIIFLYGVTTKNVQLISAFIVFIYATMILTMIFFCVAESQLRNFLAASYLLTITTVKIFLEVLAAYIATQFQYSIAVKPVNTDYLRLTNLCMRA